MKIIHTADIHLGQVIYQNYERCDEHRYYFQQLEQWCRQEAPDALVVSGDIFDIQQPSAATWKTFTDSFVSLHEANPGMAIVIVAGNHDSPSRIQSNHAVWRLAGVRLVGNPPPADYYCREGWQEAFIVRLQAGYIVCLPFMTGERTAMIQELLDYVDNENRESKPVVMTGHLTVAGSDTTGHDFDIGRVKAQDIGSLGKGYDYLALGHIHKPQTIGHENDSMAPDVTYPAPQVRYAGSAVHVSCDEAYPHTVSMVEIHRHGGDVRIRQLRIHQLRHFYNLPLHGEPYHQAEEALADLRAFTINNKSGYLRLRFDKGAVLPSDFNQMVYAILEPFGGELRYNPKIIWEGVEENDTETTDKPKFEVAELQQMTDPLVFIERTKEKYPNLSMDEIREAFAEIEEEIRLMGEQ